MKKSIKLIAVIAVVTLCLGALVACSDKTNYTKNLDTWQTMLKDKVKLVDVIMPGSHNSATKGMGNIAETQKHTVGEQLALGIRYFDFSVKKIGNQLKIYNGMMLGADFFDVLADIKAFIGSKNKQFIVLDFQHFENGAETDVANIIKDQLQPEKYAVPQGSVSKLTMGKIRNKGYKYMLTWGSAKESDREYINNRSDVLQSPYNAADHRGNGEKLISEGFGKYYDTVDESRLFVLPSVVESLLQSTKDSDDRFSPLFDGYLDMLAENPVLLKKTNIIMRNFAASNQEQIAKIIALNKAKGNF